jgi:hypothetical protein
VSEPPLATLRRLANDYSGGRERTADEFRELFAGAGLRLDNITPSATGLCVLEAVPA